MSRVEAATTRTSTSTRVAPSTLSKVCSCSTRTIFPWVSRGMSATSSRNRVPLWAVSKVPTRRRGAPSPSPSPSVPNSSISTRSGRMVAQLRATNGPSARRERACNMRATTSLPEPAGPVMRTRLLAGATRSTAWRTWAMAPDWPNNSVSVPARNRNSSFSRRRRAASMARSTSRIMRFAVNGFSMKS